MLSSFLHYTNAIRFTFSLLLNRTQNVSFAISFTPFCVLHLFYIVCVVTLSFTLIPCQFPLYFQQNVVGLRLSLLHIAFIAIIIIVIYIIRVCGRKIRHHTQLASHNMLILSIQFHMAPSPSPSSTPHTNGSSMCNVQ